MRKVAAVVLGMQVLFFLPEESLGDSFKSALALPLLLVVVVAVVAVAVWEEEGCRRLLDGGMVKNIDSGVGDVSFSFRITFTGSKTV